MMTMTPTSWRRLQRYCTCVRACFYNFTKENRSPDSSGIIDTSGQVAKYQQRSIQETFVVAEEDDDWDDDEDW